MLPVTVLTFRNLDRTGPFSRGRCRHNPLYGWLSKEVPGVRQYVAVDGGMNDNIRPALYQAKYEAATANRIGEAHNKTVSIAGKCCESGDMLIWDIDLPEVKKAIFLLFLYRRIRIQHGQQLQSNPETCSCICRKRRSSFSREKRNLRGYCQT